MLSSLCALPETVYKSTRWTLHGVECISHKSNCKRFLVSFDIRSSVTQHWSCLTLVSSARRFHSGAFPELRTKSLDVCRDFRGNTSQTDVAYHLFRNLFNDAASATETERETWYETGVQMLLVLSDASVTTYWNGTLSSWDVFICPSKRCSGDRIEVV